MSSNARSALRLEGIGSHIRRLRRTRRPGHLWWLLALAGCAGAGTTDTSDTITISSPESAIRAEALPLESVFVIGAENKSTIRKVINTLTEECMHDHGFSHLPYPDEPYSSPLDLTRRYGAITVEQAETMGYHNPTDPKWRLFYEEIDRVDAARPSTEEYLTALYGTGAQGPNGSIDRGCDGAATITIFGFSGGIAEIPGYKDVVQLQADSGAELYASSEGRKAVSAWADCMAQGGYAFDNWWDPRELYPHSIEETTEASVDEIATAVQDAECRLDTGLESALFRTESRILTRIMDENSSLLSAFKERVTASVDKAIALYPNSG